MSFWFTLQTFENWVYDSFIEVKKLLKRHERSGKKLIKKNE